MAWLFTHRPPGQSTPEYFRGQFTCTNDEATWEVLACASKHMTVYLAVRVTTKATGEAKTFGVVCRTTWKHKSYNNFGYREIEETDGPVASECPARILDLLDPTENEHALAWRARCRENIARAASRPAMKRGDIIEFAEPIQYGDRAIARFMFTDARRRVAMRADGKAYSGLFHLPEYRLKKSRGYTVDRDGKRIHPTENHQEN